MNKIEMIKQSRAIQVFLLIAMLFLTISVYVNIFSITYVFSINLVEFFKNLSSVHLTQKDEIFIKILICISIFLIILFLLLIISKITYLICEEIKEELKVEFKNTNKNKVIIFFDRLIIIALPICLFTVSYFSISIKTIYILLFLITFYLNEKLLEKIKIKKEIRNEKN